ncbi:MAG TPA: DUF1761 domain-containing protein [Ktedonobacterales bacterium]
MPGINFWAVIIAALVAFVASTVWYITFSRQLAQLSPAMAAEMKSPANWKKVAVVAQSVVLATVLAYVIGRTGARGWLDSAGIGLVLWIGLSAVQWVGSIIWEGVPVRLAALHAGDWLVKLLLISAILGTWR